MHLRRLASTIALVVAALGSRAARADDPALDIDTRDRNEWAGFPVIGGNTDIGVQLGAGGTVTHVGNRFEPYWWRADALVSGSIKNGPHGLQIVQQAHALRWDIPGGASGKVRLMPSLYFDRTVVAGYYGIGNATVVLPLASGGVGDRYRYKRRDVRTRLTARSPLGGPFALMYGLQLETIEPTPYEESRLAIDAQTHLPDGSPLIRGVRPLGIATPSIGVVYDSRDSEVYPTFGSYHLLGLRMAGALPASSGVYWAGLSIVLRRYFPLPAAFVLASRIVVDLMVGEPPFYELSQGIAFNPRGLLGGPQGIRGVPAGRYAGPIKIVADAELRRVHGSFHLFGSKFQVGTTTFVDAGRVWSDYSFEDPRDGTGVGLKVGVGAGALVIWDTALVFRVEAAYSPDAASLTPGFPLGIYAEEALAF